MDNLQLNVGWAMHGGNPHWNDSGIVFVKKDSSGNENLHLIQPGTGEERQLTHLQGAVKFPKWSPNGKWIAFRFDQLGKDDRVGLFNVEESKILWVNSSFRLMKPMPFWAPSSEGFTVCGKEGEVIFFYINGLSRSFQAQCGFPFSGGWDVESKKFYYSDGRLSLLGLELATGRVEEMNLNGRISGVDFAYQRMCL